MINEKTILNKINTVYFKDTNYEFKSFDDQYSKQNPILYYIFKNSNFSPINNENIDLNPDEFDYLLKNTNLKIPIINIAKKEKYNLASLLLFSLANKPLVMMPEKFVQEVNKEQLEYIIFNADLNVKAYNRPFVYDYLNLVCLIEENIVNDSVKALNNPKYISYIVNSSDTNSIKNIEKGINNPLLNSETMLSGRILQLYNQYLIEKDHKLLDENLNQLDNKKGIIKI